jgi:hypothetical protein
MAVIEFEPRTTSGEGNLFVQVSGPVFLLSEESPGAALAESASLETEPDMMVESDAELLNAFTAATVPLEADEFID